MSEPAAPPLERVLKRPERGVRSVVDMALNIDRDRPPSTNHVQAPTLRSRLTRKVSSCPTPVPRGDWAAVTHGSKRMYRTYAGSHRDRFVPLFPPGTEFPRPAVIYSQTGHRRLYDAALAVIIAYRQEPLGAITPEDVKAEGFESIKQFRRYWRYRYVRWGWRPNDMISVVKLRPWTQDDVVAQGQWLLEQLFGDWL